MSKEFERREAIFNKYSRNLGWIQENSNITFMSKVTDGYVCPLCFCIFKREDLIDDRANPLTFDHNPPEALGGTSGVLTCKNCNSNSGTFLDAQLLKILMESDFVERLPNSKARTKVESEGNIITADIAFEADGRMNVNLLKQYSNPKDYDKVLNGGLPIYASTNPFFGDVPPPSWCKEIAVNIKHPQNADARRAEVALLKIAYLRAFEIFGYGMLIHPFMPLVRQQIFSPNENILPNILSISTVVSRDMLGVNLLRNPKQLKCFLFVFELNTKSSNRIYAVPLPGWSTPGVDIYFPDRHQQFSVEDGPTTINCDFTHFSENDWAGKKDGAFTAMEIWFNFEKEIGLC